MHALLCQLRRRDMLEDSLEYGAEIFIHSQEPFLVGHLVLADGLAMVFAALLEAAALPTTHRVLPPRKRSAVRVLRKRRLPHHRGSRSRPGRICVGTRRKLLTGCCPQSLDARPDCSHFLPGIVVLRLPVLDVSVELSQVEVAVAVCIKLGEEVSQIVPALSFIRLYLAEFLEVDQRVAVGVGGCKLGRGRVFVFAE